MASTGFNIGDVVSYPSHGIGQVTNIESQILGGTTIELFVIQFEKDKMSLRIPVKKAESVGLRHIVAKKNMLDIVEVLQSKSRTTRGMWSKRQAEYESKINSGNLLLVAEVVRDLYKESDETNRSYSERIVYEQAVDRLVAEYAAVYKFDVAKAKEKIINILREKAEAA